MTMYRHKAQTKQCTNIVPNICNIQCTNIVSNICNTNYMPSFGRLLPSGTELIPLFPYLRAGLLKGRGGGGGQRRYTPRQLGTGIRP